MLHNITNSSNVVIGDVELDYQPCLNYAMILNHGDAITNLVITNDSYTIWLSVELSLKGEMFDPVTIEIADIPIGASVRVDDLALTPDYHKLMALTESIDTQFALTISVRGANIFSQSFPITLAAFDQWQGNTIYPEILAAFITPNHPAIQPVLHRASEILEQLTGDNSLGVGMWYEKNRVIATVRAVYNALLEQRIVYAEAPASYGQYGQRIRLADNVLTNKLGNCLDLSVLLCSCLESLHIKTTIILVHAHAFVGVWTDPTIPITAVSHDITMLTERACEDWRFLPIEATCLTRESTDFDTAVNEGLTQLRTNALNLECIIDIFQCRMDRIRPLPQSVLTPEQGWVVNDTTDYDAIFDEMANEANGNIRGTVSDKTVGKLKLWERKLLDLSLRNSLLNMKAGSRILPLPGESLDTIIKLLNEEQLTSIIERKEDFDTMKELFRAARNSIEENGANTLFLTLGTLRWYEEDCDKPHFAPVILVPIDIIRHGAKKYIIRKRDEEPTINVTLMECMKQLFSLLPPDLTQLPTTADGEVDHARVLSILRTVIEERPQWEIVDEAMIGIFSFSKFMLWHDIHTHPQALTDSPVVRSLIEGKMTWTDLSAPLDARALDSTTPPSAYALPIDVDSSQLEAVAESDRGNTFILYGPPGTGKSQTITNIIANALYHGKRVLFVAEKMAALDVVKSRLSNIGLDPFCLELHSNKADKKHFLAQMEEAINAPHTQSPREFARMSQQLMQQRLALSDHINALHRKHTLGLSLYDCINRYLAIDGDKVDISYEAVQQLTPDVIEDICSRMEEMDTVIDILSTHPSQHPLMPLLPRVNTADNQAQVTQLIRQIPVCIEEAEAKANTMLNRWIHKKSARTIFMESGIIDRLTAHAHIDESITGDLSELKAMVDRWLPHLEQMRGWYHYSTRALAIMQLPSAEAMSFFLQGHSGKDTAEALRKGIYYSIAMHIINNDEALRGFSGMLFDEVVRHYRDITAKYQNLTKQELYHRLAAQIPTQDSDAHGDEELAMLKRRIANHGRGISIRHIIDQMPTLLPRLCPCMLMSPLSVAQYLDMEADKFDLVIFDEASQIPTSEAVGTIARGKAVIVVGDPKQMPPTSFFNANTTTDEEADFDDLDSILDDCISLSITSQQLQWHYRSRHESLITFSNTHFYDGKLITFPSVDDQQSRVSFHEVEGYYDYGKSRCNRAEARAIVDEVTRRLRDAMSRCSTADLTEPNSMSIGIVAFSKVQSTLIEDMLTDALSKDKEMDTFASNSREGLFVKNLENVQGDERDVILFSVGYGPDKDGNVSMNFGPLNKNGGERRLNVAVTRARCEMRVYSTLQPEQINLQRTSAKGVVSLKRFLEYAKYGTNPIPHSQLLNIPTSTIVQQIASVIRMNGYECHIGVGKSSFRVDVAVVDPSQQDKYILGIVVDGEGYYHTPTVRDRDVVQPKVLESLGWHVVRVWTMDWFDNPKKTAGRLLTMIEHKD